MSQTDTRGLKVKLRSKKCLTEGVATRYCGRQFFRFSNRAGVQCDSLVVKRLPRFPALPVNPGPLGHSGLLTERVLFSPARISRHRAGTLPCEMRQRSACKEAGGAVRCSLSAVLPVRAVEASKDFPAWCGPNGVSASPPSDLTQRSTQRIAETRWPCEAV